MDATYVAVFPEWEHAPLWTDGVPYREALRSAGVDDDLFDRYVTWGREWCALASSELGLDDAAWSSDEAVGRWRQAGAALLAELERTLRPGVALRYFDDAGECWREVERPPA